LAWASPDAAREHLIAKWGVNRFVAATELLKLERERCEEIPDLMAAQRNQFAGYYRLRDLLKNDDMEGLARLSKSLPEWPAMPDVRDLLREFLALREQLLDHLQLAPTERTPGTLHAGNLRSTFLTTVFRLMPDFPDSPSDWAYFGIASSMESRAADAQDFKEGLRPAWKDSIPKAQAAAKKKPIAPASRREILALLSGWADASPSVHD
jgi:hypothetical protein